MSTPPFNDRFRAAVESAPNGMIMVGRGGKIAFLNLHAEKLFGYSRTELLGQAIEILVPSRFRGGHAGYRDGFFASPQTRLMGAGRELYGLRKDGTEFPIEIGLNPLKTEEGDLVLASIVDITERKRAEERFRAAVESAPNGMIMVNREGKIVLINAQTEKLFGHARSELLGQPIEILVPARYHAGHAGYRNGFFASPQTRSMGAGRELFGVRKDGTEFPIEIGLNPLKTDEGEFVLAAVVDITERKKALDEQQRLEAQNRRIQEANRLKSEFLANMSHELRTPLNAIIGFTELMVHGKVPPEETQECLVDILNSSKHLLQLINDVLDLAKVESGKIELHPEPVALSKLVTEVKDILRSLSVKRKISLEVSVEPAVEQVVIDPSKLKQVLYNYLSNALKFSSEGGRVTLRIGPDGPEFFRLDVVDMGIGISEEDFPRLFVEFQQLDAGAAKKYAGTGLGLALTKRIVEAQGGRVEVKSAPGKGSTFSAMLPRQPVGGESGHGR